MSARFKAFGLLTVFGAALVLAGLVAFVLAPLIGSDLFASLWGVEPLTYIGAALLIAGLGAIAASLVIPTLSVKQSKKGATENVEAQRWSDLTQQYFALFHHDLGRPLARILEKERELRAILALSGEKADPAVVELLNEIERQTPSFRIMLSNIQVLVQLEAPGGLARPQAVEPAQIVRRIVDRYTSVATEARKEISWWAEPTEFGIVYSDSSAIEHIVTNLVDNAVKWASEHIEVRLTKNPTHFFIRVWDDGPGIAAQYQPHVFERGWTPELARRDEKSSSGLGLFIVRTLARRFGGDVTLHSVTKPDSAHHAEFLVSLPLGNSGAT